MQALDQLSREELIALVHGLQERLTTLVDAGQAAAGDLDYVALQALTVLDNSGIAALVFDTVGTLSILAANPCLCRLAGCARDEVDRLSVAELLAPEDRDRLRRMLRLPRQGGFASAGGWRLCARSGEVREIEVSGYDLDFRGRRARFAIVQDVTQRRREQLVHERLAAIVETSRDAILSHTVDGIVLSWNRAAQRLFGYGAAELVGRSVDALLPDDIRNQERDLLRGRIAAGLPIENYHTQRQHKDGGRVDVALSVSPLRDTDGRIVGAASIIRDMRATRDAQRKLAESYQRLKLALESAALSLWDWDIPADTVIYSDEFARMLGFGPGELQRDSRLCQHLLHSEDAPALHKAMAAHLQGEHERFECEFRVRRRDGRWCWLSARGLVTRDHHGTPLRMTGTAQDVTQRRRGDALDRMLAAVLDSSDDLIVSRSLDGTVLTWNRGAERVLGWSADEIVGSSYLLNVPETQRSAVERISRIACAGHRISHLETACRHKDGRLVQLSLTVSPLRDSQGRVAGVAAIGRDITAQRDAQRALRESEARFRLLVEASAQAVWITNAAGEVEREIPSWQAYTGLSFEQVRGSGWLQAIHPEDHILTAQRWREACESGRIYATEFRLRRHDGVWRHMHAHGVPLRNEDGSIREWVGMNTDVTERKEAEAARALLAAVADSSQDAIISHDMEGTILSWNRGAEEIFGYRPAGSDRTRLPPAHPQRHTRADAGAGAAPVQRRAHRTLRGGEPSSRQPRGPGVGEPGGAARRGRARGGRHRSGAGHHRAAPRRTGSARERAAARVDLEQRRRGRRRDLRRWQH